MQRSASLFVVPAVFLLILLSGAHPAIGAATIYVDDNAPNDPAPGNPAVSDPAEDGSANHPFDAIQEGIDAATDGDEVVVLPGTYTGDGNRDLDYSHALPEGQTRAITVRSTDPDDPGTVAATVIDCQGVAGDPHRGFSFGAGEGPDSIADGVTITGGYADSPSDYLGGGILCIFSSPTIRNCVITRNPAGSGAGIAVFQGAPTVVSCTISHNGGSSNGMGIWCCGDGTVIMDSTIADNAGGGICCLEGSHLRITGCTISGNAGSGLWGYECSPMISRCTITEHSAGGVRLMEASLTITDSIISRNSARGGALANAIEVCCGDVGDVVSITNCVITDNRITEPALGNVAGVYADCDTLVIAGCTVSRNAVGGEGGGGIACAAINNITIVDSTVADNSAVGDVGGGIFGFAGGAATIAGCVVRGNRAREEGGGIWFAGGPLTIANCAVIDNHLTGEYARGAGVYSGTRPVTITNCTIAGNSAVGQESRGGGVYSQSGDFTISNCILWDNQAFEGSAVAVDGGYAVKSAISHCDVQGGPGSIYVPDGGTPPWGQGNIDADPLFASAVNYHLMAGSPCIDAGDNAAVPADTLDLDGDGNTTEPIPFDIEGNPRFLDDPDTPDCQHAPGTCGDAPIVDMGAYEYLLGAIAWRSVRGHGQLGDLPITLDAAASGSAVGCETRRFGMQRMEVAFNADISGLLTGTIEAEDLAHGGTIAPTGQYTINGGRTLVIEFVFTNLPPLPEIAGLPDGACYRIDLAGHIPGLSGDTDCAFRVLAGDINGTAPPYGDGKTDLTDLATAKANAVSGTPLTEDTCPFDVNIDGRIDLTDMALVKGLSLSGGAAACP